MVRLKSCFQGPRSHFFVSRPVIWPNRLTIEASYLKWSYLFSAILVHRQIIDEAKGFNNSTCVFSMPGICACWWLPLCLYFQTIDNCVLGCVAKITFCKLYHFWTPPYEIIAAYAKSLTSGGSVYLCEVISELLSVRSPILDISLSSKWLSGSI